MSFPRGCAHPLYNPAKILQQLKGDDNSIPLEILPWEPANDALPRFVQAYTSHSRVGTLWETQTGRLVQQWEALLADADSWPERVEMAPAIASFMAAD